MKDALQTLRSYPIGHVLRRLPLALLPALAACSSSDTTEPADPSPATATYRAGVAVSWLNLEMKLARTTPVNTTNALGRPFAYAGVAGYEAVMPGMAGYRSLAGQLNGLSALPSPDKTKQYSWPLSANAALAAISRAMFATTSAANLATVDSLENANRTALQAGLDADAVARSIDFGKKVAGAVFDWSKSDGYDNPATYTAPTGTGAWVPTPPAFGAPAFPFWGSNRPLVAGSGANADPGPPVAFSQADGSPFDLMAKEVMNQATSRTTDQTAIALFWNDAPNGRSFTPHGHWISILAQVLTRENSTLDKAALAFAKLGIAMNDATISCFKTKYTYNLMRPVSYIRQLPGQASWSPLITTPGHPEYSAGHATVSSAAAEALTEVFGSPYAFTDQNQAQFGLGTRSYASFEDAAAEAGLSRLYGGIHYRPSIEKGLVQGKRVAQNINAKLGFK
ncbi:vanadium-dependent haloperoxidase [Hymenobacter properus]|uniref:Vanadium-dependent haloperoxidase n=1 Tax=Hymenobacter properus TaxID=2791026 RepID=A0A931FMH5_9BACT|nr:vanadium-dependent haloperoxidase [Hymenobacter properus]MBF9143970.1 vanadium-dependent haloperoxidase [Hymenobacter properus]MBR7722785.1 vanadium-dependent haloperoxidase [Microvirga sp. SRT04]